VQQSAGAQASTSWMGHMDALMNKHGRRMAAQIPVAEGYEDHVHVASPALARSPLPSTSGH